MALATVLLASGVRLLEVPSYSLLVPAILVVGAIAAGAVEYRRVNGRVAHEPV